MSATQHEKPQLVVDHDRATRIVYGAIVAGLVIWLGSVLAAYSAGDVQGRAAMVERFGESSL